MLVHEFEPKIAGRFQSMLAAILYPERPEAGQNMNSLLEWEQQLRQYEEQSGEGLGESIKVATLLHNLIEPEVRNQLVISLPAQPRYDVVRRQA